MRRVTAAVRSVTLLGTRRSSVCLKPVAQGDRSFYLILSAVAVLFGGAGLLLATPPKPAAAPARGASAAKRVERRKARRSAPSRFSRGAQRRRRGVFAAGLDEVGHRRLGEPSLGDWLYSFREPGQTTTDYQRQWSLNRKTRRRDTLHLLPYDDLDAQQRRLLPVLREHLAIFFDSKVQLLPSERLKPAWLHRGRRQYRAGDIADSLSGRVLPGSLGLFGLTGVDLYALRLNYVFGLGLLTRRAGIYSVHRFGRRSPSLLRRSLHLASHEIGHMLGLKHCVFYACLMNGVNSLSEMDRKPLHLCPVCHEKLRWNLRFTPAARQQRLAAFYRRHGLQEAARWATRAATRLQGRPRASAAQRDRLRGALAEGR